MIEPISPPSQNTWEINTKSNFRSPGISAIPDTESTFDPSSLAQVLQSLGGNSSGQASIGGGTAVAGITDQEFFTAITATFTPFNGTAYGTIVGTGATGQTVDVTVTLPDINGIIDYKINVVKV